MDLANTAWAAENRTRQEGNFPKSSAVLQRRFKVMTDSLRTEQNPWRVSECSCICALPEKSLKINTLVSGI